MAQEIEPRVTLPWLVRLRWFAVLGQIAAVSFARLVRLDASFEALTALVAVAALSNLGLARCARDLPTRWSAARLMGMAILLDTVLLTALLAVAGGPMNPFTILYLVHITLSAVVLSAGWTVIIAASSVAGFGALFSLPHTDHGHHASAGTHPLYGSWHLQGMWVAFLLAALLTTFFIGRIARAIAQQREQIAALREASARNARLAAITTLAAGAAHELGSPLGTIAVAAHEARIALDARPDTQSIAEDLNLILLEVERCREILGLMAARATDPDGTAQPLRLETLERELRERLGVERSARVELQLDFDAAGLEIPPAPTLQSIVALVQNGLDATPAGERIIVAVARRGAEVHIQVMDKGAGIAESVLERVGEPFFTTKPPGRGLGLGVFLARAFAESRGGELTIESTLGAGTRACLRIPLGLDAKSAHSV